MTPDRSLSELVMNEFHILSLYRLDCGFVIDLEFVHTKSKCYLKMGIIIIILEQSSK